MVVLERGEARIGRQEEVAVLDEVDLRHLAVHREIRSRCLITSTPKALISMLSGVLNCWRMLAAESVVEDVRNVGSRSTTTIRPSKSGRAARKVATAEPMIAPPTMTTSARSSEFMARIVAVSMEPMSEPRVRFADALPATADVVIIGGGVIGCATAFFAARAGLRVLVLERRGAWGR